MIDFFIASHQGNARKAADALTVSAACHHIHIIGTAEEAQFYPESDFITVEGLQLSSRLMADIAAKATARYTAIYLAAETFVPGYRLAERVLRTMRDAHPSMLYTDRYEQRGEEETTSLHRVIDYQEGAVRDDFDFGGLLVFPTRLLRDYVAEETNEWQYAALYALRLYLSRVGHLLHLPEPLYTQRERDLRTSGQKQFDYVNPRSRAVQIEMEQVFTAHLKAIGAYLAPDEYDAPTDLNRDADYPVTASVIIPVRNREKTIGDAIRSAASQCTEFAFNVIVIDNHSTDGTSAQIACWQQGHEDAVVGRNFREVVHLIPEQPDLGIGGCWDLAIRDKRCGKYAVQLDSDDLYSGTDTLQRIVEAFAGEKAAMVIGAYRMVDFHLQTLPPGLIDHAEWTDNNGRNNALRINGLGAPRAFSTALLRKLGVPNTSYGEDYALGLAISRRYRIARIYDELYLCRRWEGNSDAALSNEKVNRNNEYKDTLRSMEIAARRKMNRRWETPISEEEVATMQARQMASWQEVRENFEDLSQHVEHRRLEVDDALSLTVQHNPRRIVSTAAKVDHKSIEKRPCFLCACNRPQQQLSFDVERHFTVLVNPYPILPCHLTIPTRRHLPQQFAPYMEDYLRMIWRMPQYCVFYNGPHSGASAPDHAHFQAGLRGIIPIERAWKQYEHHLECVYPATLSERALLEELGYTDPRAGIYLLHGYACPAFVVMGETENGNARLLQSLLGVMPVKEGCDEPDINVLSWREKGTAVLPDCIVNVVFARRQHRPACYYAQDERERYLISPGTIDMGGLIITPRREDFERLTIECAVSILQEVTYSESELRQMAAHLHAEREEDGAAEEGFAEGEEPIVEVGIMHAATIDFVLHETYTAKGQEVTGAQRARYVDGGIEWQGNIYSELNFRPQKGGRFTLCDVVIGKGFHWQKAEEQTFTGSIRLIVNEERIEVINCVAVEQYLKSVISSEMRATAPFELLKAHAVISRSWLLRQMAQRRQVQQSGADGAGFFTFQRHKGELLRWYDRTEHALFDVCADDHCQRYQGITRATTAEVAKAVEQTHGEVLTYDGELCDARFSKCCGGVTERFSACWDAHDEPYLVPTTDPYCLRADDAILTRSLNDYDVATHDFKAWEVTLTNEEIVRLLREKLNLEIGQIQSMKPIEVGESGRIIRLQIEGTAQTVVIGKELEIRRALSPSHLLSSAFTIEAQAMDADGLPQRFVLSGKGWGHGVGLCQIGAAVMAEEGHYYEDILGHYYHHAKVTRHY